MKLAINLMLFVIISATAFAGKSPSTKYYPCDTYTIKSKTYVDSDQDGKYDHVQVTDCEGNTTIETYQESAVTQFVAGDPGGSSTGAGTQGGLVDFWDGKNIDDYTDVIDFHTVDTNGNISYRFIIYDSNNNLVATEYKPYTSSIAYITEI